MFISSKYDSYVTPVNLPLKFKFKTTMEQEEPKLSERAKTVISNFEEHFKVNCAGTKDFEEIRRLNAAYHYASREQILDRLMKDVALNFNLLSTEEKNLVMRKLPGLEGFLYRVPQYLKEKIAEYNRCQKAPESGITMEITDPDEIRFILKNRETRLIDSKYLERKQLMKDTIRFILDKMEKAENKVVAECEEELNKVYKIYAEKLATEREVHRAMFKPATAHLSNNEMKALEREYSTVNYSFRERDLDEEIHRLKVSCFNN